MVIFTAPVIYGLQLCYSCSFTSWIRTWAWRLKWGHGRQFNEVHKKIRIKTYPTQTDKATGMNHIEFIFQIITMNKWRHSHSSFPVSATFVEYLCMPVILKI